METKISESTLALAKAVIPNFQGHCKNMLVMRKHR